MASVLRWLPFLLLCGLRMDCNYGAIGSNSSLPIRNMTTAHTQLHNRPQTRKCVRMYTTCTPRNIITTLRSHQPTAIGFHACDDLRTTRRRPHQAAQNRKKSSCENSEREMLCR